MIGVLSSAQNSSGQTRTDPYWDDVIFMAPFTNDFSDKSNSSITTTNVGSCSIDPSDGAIGSGCLSTPISGFIKASINAAFGSGDFTIEVFAKTAASSPFYFGLFSFETAEMSDYGLWVVTNFASSANSGRTWVSSNGSSWNVAVNHDIGPVNDNAWHHHAITRDGDELRVFKDGVIVFSNTLSPGLSLTQKGPWATFGSKDVDATKGAATKLQYARVTKGVARYTSSFTPPSKPFPQQ